MAQDDMLKAAEVEVLRLEAEIAKTPLGQKLALAKQVVVLYRKDEDAVINGEFTRIHVTPRGREREIVNAELTTKAARIERVCGDYLRSKNGRATSGELAEIVEKAGIHLSGVMPSKSLAAVLSNSDFFDNVRDKGGYGLVEWSQRNQGIETATSQ